MPTAKRVLVSWCSPPARSYNNKYEDNSKRSEHSFLFCLKCFGAKDQGKPFKDPERFTFTLWKAANYNNAIQHNARFGQALAS